MREVFIIVAAGAVGAVAGYAIGSFVKARQNLAVLLATMAPLMIYVWFFLASEKPDGGTTMGWFLTGLVFTSPVIVPWMVCVLIGWRMGRGHEPELARQDAGR